MLRNCRQNSKFKVQNLTFRYLFRVLAIFDFLLTWKCAKCSRTKRENVPSFQFFLLQPISVNSNKINNFSGFFKSVSKILFECFEFEILTILMLQNIFLVRLRLANVSKHILSLWNFNLFLRVWQIIQIDRQIIITLRSVHKSQVETLRQRLNLSPGNATIWYHRIKSKPSVEKLDARTNWVLCQRSNFDGVGFVVLEKSFRFDIAFIKCWHQVFTFDILTQSLFSSSLFHCRISPLLLFLPFQFVEICDYVECG